RVQIAGARVRIPLVLLHFPFCLRFWGPRRLRHVCLLVPRRRRREERLTGFTTGVVSSFERGTEHYDVNATRTRTLSSQNGLCAAIGRDRSSDFFRASPVVRDGTTARTDGGLRKH